MPRVLGKEVAFKLSDLHRSTVPTLAWERNSEEKGYCYVEWGVGDYAGLECAWKEKRLTYAHEVVRNCSRVAFDVDLQGDELLRVTPPRDELVALMELVVRRVLRLYYDEETVGELRFVWLDGSCEGKTSLHLVVNGAVFYYREGDRRQLRELYDLVEHEALHCGLFGSFLYRGCLTVHSRATCSCAYLEQRSVEVHQQCRFGCCTRIEATSCTRHCCATGVGRTRPSSFGT